MKKLLFIVVVSTLLILGLHAQNSASSFAPVSAQKSTKSERYEIIKKDGKLIGLFDKVSQKRINLDGSDASNMSAAKAQLSIVTKKSAREDVATVTLTVIGDPWGPGLGTGTGLQLFLDADAEIVDNFWDYFWEDERYFFDNSEYKIPENAVYGFNNPQVILDGTGSVDIPGGVYDFLFLRPWPMMEMYLITNWAGSGEMAMADNFTFVAGFEYIFTVETPGDVVFETPEDIKLSKVILPQPSLNLTDQEEIAVVLYNNGMESITGEVELSYTINDADYIIIETYFISELAPGEEITYTFNEKANFSTIGFYTVTARVDYEFDSNPYNNAMAGQTKKFELISDLPFFDNFDTQSSMLKWLTIDGNGDGYSWLYDNWFLTDADGGKGCLQVLCQSYGANEYLILDPVAMWPNVFDLSFYAYRLGNDKIKILYGTTPNVEEMELLEVVTPNSSDWGKIHVPVLINTPGNYFFAFHYEGVYSTGSRGVNFDNFMIEPLGNIPDITLKHQLKLYPNPVYRSWRNSFKICGEIV